MRIVFVNCIVQRMMNKRWAVLLRFIINCAIVIITSKIAERPEKQQQFFEDAGLSRMPITWMDDYQDYEVYTKGHIEMGAFASLMDRVEFIGKEIVYKCRGDERY